MKFIKTKIPEYEVSIFTTMSKMAHTHGALNLSQGSPDFGADPELIKLAQNFLEDEFNQYAPMPGIFSLRETIAEKVFSLHRAEYHPESEITITCGATQAIYTAVAAMVYPGDEVIVLKPAYDCYEPAILAQGGIPIPVQLEGSNFSINWSRLEEAISAKTRMLIINTPHNPSGRVFSKTEMEQLQQLLKGTDIFLVSDEVYEHLVFDGKEHQSASRFDDLRSRSFVCASFGKTFHVTGWKLGYCLAPEPLMYEFRKVHEFNVFSVAHPLQRAIGAYLQDPRHYLGLNDFFESKRNLFLEGLKNSRFQFKPTEGTYFQILDYSQITDEPDTVFAERLTKSFGVASIPISVFNLHKEDHKQLRFCFAKKNETLCKAVEILKTL